MKNIWGRITNTHVTHILRTMHPLDWHVRNAGVTDPEPLVRKPLVKKHRNRSICGLLFRSETMLHGDPLPELGNVLCQRCARQVDKALFSVFPSTHYNDSPLYHALMKAGMRWTGMGYQGERGCTIKFTLYHTKDWQKADEHVYTAQVFNPLTWGWLRESMQATLEYVWEVFARMVGVSLWKGVEQGLNYFQRELDEGLCET